MLAFPLAACTDQDWSHALSFVGVGGQTQGPAPARPRPAPEAGMAEPAAPKPATPPAEEQASAAPRLNAFCQTVAEQDAQNNDFDAATQARVLVRSYRQCVAVFGNDAQ